MKKLIVGLLLLFPNLMSAQESPHYTQVYNVYRRDVKAINEYAVEFITNNSELFLWDQSSNSGKHNIDTNKSNFIPYYLTDSGVIANGIFIHKTDTIFATIGFLSKNNRTKIILLSAKNYRDNYLLKDFIKARIDIIIEKYHSLLKSKNSDTKNW